MRILTPEEFESLLAEIPGRFNDLVRTDIETGLRWGELVALRPRHVDFLRRVLSVEATVVEVSKRNSPTGVSQDLLDLLARRIERMGLGRDDLLFPSTQARGDVPLSRNTFRTRYWLPALARAGIDFQVRFHDLRQIQTTQKYLHTLPDADDKALDAFIRVRARRQRP